jgi:DNA-binding response OmpR family regulator
MSAIAKHQLLIIEPDPDMRASLVDYLEDSFDVVCVRRGDEAIGYLGDHVVDVVLTEIDLPGELGITVLTELRDSGHTSGIVAVYGYGDRFQRLEPMARRVADVVLVKPLELGRLERTLLSLCPTRRGDGESANAKRHDA